jgi:O-antigen ligase
MATAAYARAERSSGLAAGVIGLVVLALAGGIGVAVGEVQALVASLAVIASVAVLVDYRAGAVLLIVLTPISASYLFPHEMFGVTGLNPLNLLLVATLMSFLMHARGLRTFLPKPLAWLYIVPILVAAALGARHVNEIPPLFYEQELINYVDALGYIRDAAIRPLFLVLTALVIGAAVTRSQKPERFIIPVIVAVWAMSLLSIIYVAASGISLGFLASASERGFFAAALGMHANELGRLYAVAYALLLFVWGETKDLTLKTVLVATMGVLTLALLLTFSRGAFLGFFIVNALFLVWKFNMRTLGIAMLVAALALPLMPGAVWDRLSLGFGGAGDANSVSAGRIDEIWTPLMPEILHTAPWGNGLDAILWSKAMWAQTILEVTHPHNAYLQALLDMGLIGTLLLLAYYWHVARGFRALGSNAYLSPTLRGFFQGGLAGLICFLVTGMAGSSLRPTPEFTFLWFAIGMMYGTLARKPASTT